jgi:hypothetical protein
MIVLACCDTALAASVTRRYLSTGVMSISCFDSQNMTDILAHVNSFSVALASGKCESASTTRPRSESDPTRATTAVAGGVASQALERQAVARKVNRYHAHQRCENRKAAYDCEIDFKSTN